MNKVGQRDNLDRNLPVTLWALDCFTRFLTIFFVSKGTTIVSITSKTKNPYKVYKYIINIVTEKLKMLRGT